MKKVLAIILPVLILCTAFVACSSDKDGDTGNEGKVSTTATIETEKAVIKDEDAIDYIKNAYTAEELGLADVDKDYSFMVAKSGVDIDGKKYVKVAANVMSQSDVTTEDGKTTYKLTPVGEYYISFDGKSVLTRDMKTGEYKKLDNRYDDYKSKGEATQEAKEDTTEKK